MINRNSKFKKIIIIICVILLIVVILSITLLSIFKSKYSSIEKLVYAFDAADIKKETVYTIIDDLEQNEGIFNYILSNIDTPEKIFSEKNDVEKINTIINIFKKNLTSAQLGCFIHNLFIAPKTKGLTNVGTLLKYYDREKIDKIKSYKVIDYYEKINDKIHNDDNISHETNKVYNLALTDWLEFTSSCYILFDYIESISQEDTFAYINYLKTIILEDNYFENIAIKDLIFIINMSCKGLINIEDYNGILNVCNYFVDNKYIKAISKAPSTFKSIIQIASKINANDLMYMFGDYPHIEKIYNNVFYYFKINTDDFVTNNKLYANEIAESLNVLDCDKKYNSETILIMFDYARDIEDIGFTSSELEFWTKNQIKFS